MIGRNFSKNKNVANDFWLKIAKVLLVFFWNLQKPPPTALSTAANNPLPSQRRKDWESCSTGVFAGESHGHNENDWIISIDSTINFYQLICAKPSFLLRKTRTPATTRCFYLTCRCFFFILWVAKKKKQITPKSIQTLAIFWVVLGTSSNLGPFFQSWGQFRWVWVWDLSNSALIKRFLWITTSQGWDGVCW